MKSLNQNIILKLLCIIAFSAITLSLIIINYVGVANGYEISIYNVYPIYFWFLVFLAIFCGITVLVYLAFNKKKSNLWVPGLIALFLAIFLILLLPLFRNYFIMGRGDVLTHIGLAIDIVNSGHFGIIGTKGENLYPILHVTMTIFYYLTGISLNLQTKILPIVYYVFFIFSLYLLSGEIAKENGKKLLIMAFGSILFLQYETLMIAPSVQAFLLIPFILYLFYKTRKSKTEIMEYSIIFVLFLILIPFFHPGEVTFFLLITFVLIYISDRIYQKIYKNRLDSKVDFSLYSNNKTFLLLLIVVWISWFASFSSFLSKFSQTISWFTSEVGKSNYMQYSAIMSNVHYPLNELLFLFIKIYGQYVLFFVLSTIVCIIILKRVFINKIKVDFNVFRLVVLFGFFAFYILFSFINVTGVEFNRVLKYEMLIAILLNGIFFYSFFKKKEELKKVGMIFLISFLMIAGTIGIFNAYPSPITNSPNNQVTEMELTGHNWFLDHRNTKLIIDTNINLYSGQVLRFTDAVKGGNYRYLNKIIVYYGPDHFNYNNKSSYGETYDTNWYYLDTKLLRISYPSLYPNYEDKWKLTPSDYYKFDNLDTSVNYIYADGDYNIYYIRSKQSQL